MVGVPECRDELVRGRTSPAPRMFATELDPTSLPARGLLYSVLVHGLFAVVVINVPWDYWLPREVHLVMAQSTIREHEVLLLPNLEPMGSDSPAPSHHSEVTNKQRDIASSYNARAVQGVVYKGPQLIVSNPPHPDNIIQTVQQPDLVAKPKLPAPLPLPPVVSFAPARPVLAPQPPQPAPDVTHESVPVPVLAAEPVGFSQQQPRVEAPKLPFSTASPTDALNTAASAPLPVLKPKIERASPSTQSGSAEHNVLVANAIPRQDRNSALPPGELHGSFTVSPEGTSAATNLAGGGADSKGAPGMANATGIGPGPYAGNGSKSSASVSSGADAGSIHGGKEVSNGVGPGLHVSGSGSGTGTGSGRSPFPSITIQGGSPGSGRSAASTTVSVTTQPQNSYGLTIVASGASGGGFKDFGVFRNEASYTVYLDMADIGAPGASWTLQYALDSHRASSRTLNLSDAASHPQRSLASPFAIVKTLPHFPRDLARRGRGSTIMVLGVIGLQGELEDLRIMQSPEPGLNPLLLASLKNWKFRPAEVDGARVSVKVLLGVPVNSVPTE